MTVWSSSNEIPFRIFDYSPAKETLVKQREELMVYDAVLNNKSLQHIEINLNDGVMVNSMFDGLIG